MDRTFTGRQESWQRADQDVESTGGVRGEKRRIPASGPPGRCSGESLQESCPRELEDGSACRPVGCSLNRRSFWSRAEPRSLSGCLGVLVSAPLLYDSLCACMCLCVSHFRFSACLSRSVSFLPSLSVAWCVCVCVSVCVCLCLEVCLEESALCAQKRFLAHRLSLVSLPPRLCLGHVSACQAFARRLHFGFVKASTT